MKSFAQLVWFIAILLAFLGIFVGVPAYEQAEHVTHQMQAVLMIVAFAVVPYCIARGVHAMVSLSDGVAKPVKPEVLDRPG